MGERERGERIERRDNKAAVFHYVLLPYYVGPIAPYIPVNIYIISKHAQEVTLSLVVPMVAYTQEHYRIFYGTNQNVFPFSERINGSSDLTLRNQAYMVTLAGLHGNTVYYYQVMAINTHSFNLTGLLNFTTPTSCKLCTKKCCYYYYYF